MTQRQRTQRISPGLVVLFFAVVFGGAIFLAHSLASDPAIQVTVAEYGYFGVLITGVIAGLNAFFPVPAATLTPLFVGAGLTLPLIVLSLTLGTLIADFTGFALGHVSREMVAQRYPRTTTFFTNLYHRRRTLVLPAAFLYAAFVPFPNEAILIPLALAGARFSLLLVPLFLGNLLHQAILVYGINGLLGWLI